MRLNIMGGRKRKILLIIIAGIVILCLAIIFVSVNKKNKIIEDLVPDDTVKYITKQVIDYPEDINGIPVIWETIYNEENSISIVYADGKEIKRFSGGVINKAVDFSPEVKGSLVAQVDDILSNDDMGIIYSVDMDRSLSYVASLIDKGYRLIRKVLDANYAEVYLKSPEAKTIRILVLTDKMLMAELDKDIVLDDIESYFN